MSFEPNQGQADPHVNFFSRGPGYTLFLTADSAVFSLSKSHGVLKRREPLSNADPAAPDSALITMRLKNSRTDSPVRGIDELPGKINYLRGTNPGNWRTNVPTFARVRYEDVYPGVNLIYYGNQRQLEYDFEIAAGADPAVIRLSITGARLRLEQPGNLRVGTASGEVSFLKPYAYQLAHGKRQKIFCRYVMTAKNEVAFALGSYDRSLPLVIDPVLSYSTYLGGADDEFGSGIAVDAAGSAYITGQTYSTDFPVSGSLHPDGSLDAFVTKLTPTGSALLYSTILGGSKADIGWAIAVNAAGNAFVTGQTISSDFPLQNPLDSTLGSADAFVAELNPAGSALVYSTLLGGSSYDLGYSIAVDQNGNAYVTGETGSHDFPLTNPIQNAKSGHALFKSSDAAGHWSASDAGLAAATANGIAFDPTNSATLLAATDVGIFKSINSGVNWAPIALPQAALPVENIAIDPATPSIIYAATNGGVYKSIDGGGSFVASNTGLSPLFTRTVVINPLNPTILYACGTGARVYRTTDGAGNWLSSLLNGASLAFSLVVDPTNTAVVYAGSNRGVYKSTDGGVTWLAPNTSLRSSIRSLAVDRNNPSIIYAGTNQMIFKSTDGGINWSDITRTGSFGSVNAIAIDPADSAKVYYGGSSNIYKSNDAGATWSLSSSGYSGTAVNSLIVDPSIPANLYVGTSAGSDIFVTKINSAGTAKIYSTYLGGSLSDVANGIALDAAGAAYVTGYTLSTNFPSANSFQSANGGDYDSFISKLNSAGSALEYSTYLGGSSADIGWGIAVDSSGNAYVAGSTYSDNFPTANAFQPVKASLAFHDVFITKLNAGGTALVYSTYLGGTADNQGHCIAVNSQGNAFIGGLTSSVNFPRTGQIGNLTPVTGDTDAFVSKLDSTGSTLSYSTRLGGTGFDQAWAIALDSAGSAYVTGETMSGDFPTVNPFQGLADGSEQVFITKIAASPALLHFTSDTFNVSEGAGSVLITVTREGSTTGAASVDYVTTDASASQKRDYTLAAGTLSFAAGELSKAFRILLTDNAYVDGTRAIKVTLSNPAGADLGEPTVASVLIADNDTTPPASNPIDDAQFFVRQHYSDFLSRVPDQAGLDYWSGQITQCGSDQACLRTKRIDVSNAFFYEQEYQQTGAYVYRLYRAAFGNNQPFPNPDANPLYPNEAKKLPSYAAFAPDRARVKGGASLAQSQLDLAAAFVQRPAFLAKYAADGSGFVDDVLTTLRVDVGVDLASERQKLIDLVNQGGRAAVMYRLADDNLQTNPINNRAFIDAEYNRAFVVTQYFGYLRRNPDIGGFVFWLGQVNGAPLRDVARQHAMVCSFITSTEYQQRFSQVVTHSNVECQ